MRLHPHLLIPVLGLSLCGLGGCSSSGADQDADTIAVSGVIIDDGGSPVINALVTVNGVEAQTKTDASGAYTVQVPEGLSEAFLLTAAADNHETLVERFTKAGADEARRIRLETRELLAATAPNHLQITSPADGSAVVDDPCGSEITVRGVVGRIATGNARLDLVVIIDASGSTSRAAAGGGGSIYDLQIEAARQLADRLGNGMTRMAVIRFAASATVRQALTADTAAITATLDAMQDEGPTVLGSAGSGTDYSAALAAAGSHLAATPLVIDAEGVDGSGDPTHVSELVPTRQAVVLLSDGVPTLPVAPGLTQERGDIDAALAAAQTLADADILVHGFAVGVDETQRRLTTLPTIAHLTGGDYQVLNDAAQLPAVLTGTPLVGVGHVVVTNDAFPGESYEGIPDSAGCFAVTVPVAAGSQILTVSAHKKKQAVQGLSESISVTAVGTPDLDLPYGLAGPVSVRGLRSPYDAALAPAPHRFPAHMAGEFPFSELQESLGTQLWAVAGSGAQTLDVRLLGRHAGWKNTIGYLELTPAEALDLAASVAAKFAALDGGADENVLVAQSDWNNASAQEWSHPADTTPPVAQIDADGANYIVLWMVSNGSLTQGLNGQKPVFFSVDSLNPGAFDQMLSYYSAAGRGGTGGSEILLVAEDIPLVNKSDRDYWDVGVSITGLVPALLPSCPLSDD